ncbi:protein odd-skipped-like [Biomphalaria glabrata]|uniref:Protein odd-skipped-like n=2 Tax=Biomphalaria glabrata TaxID=6526 RepID=A0A2C9K7M1_BIOGL|nr:protein odd-skipped-like [Biomphalaria glabrata]KAI8737758.1 protein odd-skipped-like isoform X1 [Biomphalaria glabrata]KAI8795514.1 protein odd-skipped isoform X1 [Biomphalaria glabrata]
MDSYPVNDHGMPGTGQPGQSQSPDILQDQHLQQLHQSIQQQQQQLHQQLTSGSSSISELIGMLPQTASLSSGSSMASPDYRSSSHLPLSTSPMYSRHSNSSSHGSSQSTPGPSHSHQSSSDHHDRSEPSISSIAYTRQGDSFVCSLCGKVVVSKAAITRHIQLTHEKKKPFECNICHRRFGYKNILMEHQNIHFGIKPYACTLCDKRFAARSNLFQHRLLHMKPFCCYICNKRFDRDEQLQRHLKLHPTANVLSCSQCPFTATNVEALNQHLQESHKLLTYDTRRHSSSFDSDSGDPPSQVVMSLPSPTLTSPDKSPGHMSLTMDSEAMRRIDTICSQLASRGQNHHSENSQVKQEPLSPGGVRFPSDNHFPSASPSSRDHHHFSHGSPTSSLTSGGSRSQTRLPPFSANLARSYSNPSDPEQGSPLSMTTGRKDASPIPGLDVLASKFYNSPRFLPPNRRTNSMNSMNPMNSLRHGQSAEHVRSIADSTSNLSEFFSTLQGLVQRSQEIPELHVNISKPKITREIGTQYNNTSMPGELPSLEDLLIYYESQGRLYRCQHCRISFEERGLYFLHKSLHGEMSPWQCSICHKICADRNDFHLHFVNQQHRPDQMMH